MTDQSLQQGTLDDQDFNKAADTAYPTQSQQGTNPESDPTIQGSPAAPPPTDPWKTISNNRQMAVVEVQRAYYNLDVLNRPGLNDDQVRQLMKSGPQSTPSNLQTEYPGEPWYVRGAADAAAMEPGLEDMVKQGGVGWAAGTAADTVLAPGYAAASSTGAGAIVSGIIGSTLPIAGFTIGSANSAWHQSAGEMAGELMQNPDIVKNGIDRNTVRNVSYTFGAINGAFQMLGPKVLRSFGGRTLAAAETRVLAKALTGEAVTKVFSNQATKIGVHYVAATLEQSGIGAAGAFMNSFTKMMVAIIQHQNPNTYEDWPTTVKKTWDTFTHSLAGSALTTAGAGAAGHAAGAITGEVKSRIPSGFTEATQGKTVPELMNQLTASLKEQHTEPGEVSINSKGQVTLKATAKKQLEQMTENPLDSLFGELASDTPPETDEGRPIIPGDYSWDLTAEASQARRNQIESDLNVLDKETHRLTIEIRRKEKLGQDTSKDLQKLQKVYHTADNLQHEGRLLEEGLNTDVSQGGAYGKIRMSRLNKIFDDLQEDSRKAFKSGVSYVASLQDKLEQTVEAATKDPGIRAKARLYINGVTTHEQFQKAVDVIYKNVQKMEEAKQQARNLKIGRLAEEKITKMLKGNAVRLAGGKPTSELPLDVTTNLQLLRGFLRNEKTIDDTVADFNITYSGALGSGNLDSVPAEDLLKFRIAQIAKTVLHGTAQQKSDVATKLADVIAGGKEQIEKQRQIKTFLNQQTINRAKASLLGITERRGAPKPRRDRSEFFKNHPDSDIIEGILQNEEKRSNPDRRQETSLPSKEPSQTKKNLRQAAANIKTMQHLMEFLTPKDRDHTLAKMTDGTHAMHVFKENMDAGANVLHQTIKQSLRDAGLDMSDTDYMNRMAQNASQKFNVTSTLRGGVKSTAQWTKDQMITIWNIAQMPAEKENLRAAGVSFPGDDSKGNDTISTIGRFLDKTDKAIAEGIQKDYKNYYENRSNPFWQTKFNVDLGAVDNYSPAPKKGVSRDVPLDKPYKNVVTETPRSALVKYQNVQPIDIRGAVEENTRYKREWEHKIAYSDLLDTHNAIFGDPSIRAHISENYGHGTLDVVDNFRRQFLANDPTPRDKTGLSAAISGDIAMNLLGFRWGNSILTHLSSGSAMLTDYSPGEILAAGGRLAVNARTTMPAIWDAPIIKSRRKEGPAADLQASFRRDAPLFGRTISHFTGADFSAETPQAYQLFNRLAFAGISYGDSVKAATFGGIVYHAELARNGGDHALAIEAVERKMEQTQQGTGPGSLPNIYSQSSMAHLALGLFQNEHTQLTGQIHTAVNDWVNSPKKPGDTAKLGATLVGSMLVPGLMMGVQRNLPSLISPQDEDTRKKAIYQSIVSSVTPATNGIPLLGSIAESVYMGAAKPLLGLDTQGSEKFAQSNPVADMVYGNFKNAFNAIISENKEPKNPFTIPIGPPKKDKDTAAENTAVKVGKAATSALGLPGAGISEPIDLVHTLRTGDNPGAAYTLMGLPHGSITQAEQHKPPSFIQSINQTKKDEGALGAAWHFARGYMGSHSGNDLKDSPDKLFEQGYFNGK